MKLSKQKLEMAFARTQKTFKTLKGVSDLTVSKAMKGLDIAPQAAGRIAAALGVDITELMED